MMMLPGVYAYFGPIVEASAFGSKIVWPENGPPWAPPFMKDITEIDHLKIPNPKTDGLMPKVLEEYRYFWKHLDPYYI